MLQTVQWLIRIEEMAGDFYSLAATHFQQDKKLNHLLNKLSEDEAMHYHLMGSAAEFLRENEDTINSIIVDRQTKDNIENPFDNTYGMLTAGTLTKESLLDCIITTEFSEWNNIYQYIINTLMLKNRKFSLAASKMQGHLSMIENVLSELPNGESYVAKIHQIPAIWEKKILIVDDYEPITKLLSSLLKSEGIIRVAKNGKEGYNIVSNEYFDIIISDLEMPVMDGMEFYNQSIKLDPDLKERFLFFTGVEHQEYLDFITKNNLRLIKKPGELSNIKQTVHEILSGTFY